MSSIHSRVFWCNGTIDELKNTIDTLPYQYTSSYISLGGKYNVPTVTFSNPSYLANHDFPSNTQYQMFPIFVRFQKKKERCLIIIVDSFDNEEVREMNIILIQRAVSQFSNIDVVLYDTKLHLTNIRPFAQTMVDWLVFNDISPNKCMFANYIRFRGCSSIDNAQLEVIIPQTIQTVLTESKRYTDCLYQWFGYQYYTYNLLYSYKKYDMSRHLKVIMLFHECAEATQVVSGNASNLFMFDLAREKTNKNVLMEFLKYTIDITSYSKCIDDSMYSRMSDFCNCESIDVDYVDLTPKCDTIRRCVM